MRSLLVSVGVLLCVFVIEQVRALPMQPNPEESTNPALHQGDMLLEPPSKGKGVAVRYPYGTPWPRGEVPYEFAGNVTLNNTLFIVQQMRAMESLTAVNGTQCIRFREKNASDTIFLTIFNGSGCYAPVGSWGNYNGVRGVSLMDSPTSTCMITGTVQHELNHALGFYHEQSRPDRDTYVSIQWSNIQSASAYNFDKYNYSQVDTQQTPYDYGSVMHYSANSFAINSSAPTIVAVFNSSANLGQRIQLSPIDILEIQRFYNCVATPPNSNATTTTPMSTTSQTTLTSSTTSTTSRTTSTSATTTTTSRTTTTSQTTTSATTATTTSATTVTTTSETTTTETTATTTAGAASLWNPIQSPLALLLFVLISSVHLRHFG